MKQSIRFSIKTSIPDITNSTLGGDVLEAKQQELFFSELRGIRDKVSQLSIFANGNNDSSNEKLISLYELHTIFFLLRMLFLKYSHLRKLVLKMAHKMDSHR